MKTTTNMNDKECCANCALCKRLELILFYEDNASYESYDGYACLAFINDGVVRHLCGYDPELKTCDYFTPKLDINKRSSSRFIYRGYKGTVEYDPGLRYYSGKIVDGWGEFYGGTVDELYEDFKRKVDKYIEWCETITENPERRDAWGKNIKIVKEGELYKCIKPKDTK